MIGSAFGDEGKGLVTDVLASGYVDDTVVVRFNGGAQAGHTVVTPEGQRHVFSHFGSGTFAGAATFLSRFFVVNPILYHREREQLERLGVSAQVFVDGRSNVTTPFDMFINTALERQRGSDRHGSCGVGFGETVGRNQNAAFALTMADLARPDLEARLRSIRDRWFLQRLGGLGLNMSDAERATLCSDALLARFRDDALAMLDTIRLGDESVLCGASHVVFEGAQGLLLDQEMGYFPYVTRSYTGLRNVAALVAGTGITSLDVHYVLRPYLTRHGAGPLPGELPNPPFPGVVDQTNIPNDWQGSLRFALLDLDVLRSSIERDTRHCGLPTGIGLNRMIAITCLDQVTDEVRFLQSGTEATARPDDFVLRCRNATSANRVLTSRGPARCECCLTFQ